jgi:hypothetical protein
MKYIFEEIRSYRITADSLDDAYEVMGSEEMSDFEVQDERDLRFIGEEK